MAGARRNNSPADAAAPELAPPTLLAQDTHADQTLDGSIERFVFRNEDRAFVVAKLARASGRNPPRAATGQALPLDRGEDASSHIPDGAMTGGLVTIVGELLGVSEGLPLRLRGTWVHDKKWGHQFRFSSYQILEPNTLVGIERFLGSGLIAGIGPELARRLVEKFGVDTLEIIANAPKQLTQVSGIGAARAEKIAAALATARHVQDVMVFLRGHGVSAAFAARIVKRYGNAAVRLIRENPYRLAREIWGIGFRTADAVAQKLGIARDAPARLEAGLLFALDTSAEDGHVHLPRGRLFELTAELLQIDSAKLAEPLATLIQSELVIAELMGVHGTCVALPRLHIAECLAATRLREVLEIPGRTLALDVNAAVVDYERSAGLALAEQQRRAITAALLDKCVVITGGPGVGKTTIIRGIVHLASITRRQVALAAPTGRAAKRLAEATAAPALTIHRLLEYQPHEGTFARNAETPLDVDMVVIDEASMVDILLFASLLSAVRPSTQLILVGDIDQLPSVGPGAVLADIIASDAVTVIRLTEIFRQAAASKIVTSAHRINHGELPDLATDATRDDFFFIERQDPQLARDTIVELVTERIPARFGFDPLADIQVLVPMHRGPLGTEALNAALQAKLVPETQSVLRRGEREFRAGDRVMQLKNDYERNVYNGDIGAIISVAVQQGMIKVEFGDSRDSRVVDYEKNDLDQLTHAFAVSIHKSQGSEYPAVVIPLATQHFMMLQRSLLYTAVTRGKRLVVIVGSRKALNMAIRSEDAKRRLTFLAERLRATNNEL